MRKLQSIIIGWHNYLFTNKKELITERYSLCKECPVSKKNGKQTGWCRVKNGGCGCYLKAKAAHDDESCPHGVWGPQFTNREALNELIANGHG